MKGLEAYILQFAKLSPTYTCPQLGGQEDNG